MTFGFASSEANSTFACRFDSAATFTPCTSPITYSGLAQGTHTFRVRATDPAGNTDPTPAMSSVTVDTTPPQTRITEHPHRVVTTSGRRLTAKFAFTSSRRGSAFACKLDGSAWDRCKSPRRYRVRRGTHTFKIRATDPSGNIDPTAAKWRWKVKRG